MCEKKMVFVICIKTIPDLRSTLSQAAKLSEGQYYGIFHADFSSLLQSFLDFECELSKCIVRRLKYKQ